MQIFVPFFSHFSEFLFQKETGGEGIIQIIRQYTRPKDGARVQNLKLLAQEKVHKEDLLIKRLSKVAILHKKRLYKVFFRK